MLRFAFLLSCLLVLPDLFLFSAATAQEKSQKDATTCQFNIAGTWQSFTDGHLNPTVRRFAPGGVTTELSRRSAGKGYIWQATGKSTYRLDDPKAPKNLVLTPLDAKGEATPAKLHVVAFDDGLFVTAQDGKGEPIFTRWTRVDPQRYFVVFAAGKGTPGFGAAGFAMLIKTDGGHTQVDSFGVYPVVRPFDRHPMLGAIPSKIRKQFDKEPTDDSRAMLRIEVTEGPYERALEVLRTWKRRADEDTLLYTVPYLNNAVYLNQLASSLDETGVLSWEGGAFCSETIKEQKLTWLLGDPIMSKHNLPQTPYYLFKALRQLNEPLNLGDDQFRLALTGRQPAPVVISTQMR